jgi:hypothetical protein
MSREIWNAEDVAQEEALGRGAAYEICNGMLLGYTAAIMFQRPASN